MACNGSDDEVELSKLTDSLVSVPLLDEKSFEDSIEQMKDEDSRMEDVIKSIDYGQEYMEVRIVIMKCREKRLSHEIDLMRRREKSLEVILSAGTSILDYESHIRATETDLKAMEKQEQHMNHEIERMVHFERRITNQLRSMERTIDYLEDHSVGILRRIRNNAKSLMIYDHTIPNQLEGHRNEMAKLETKLQEHRKEITKRIERFDEHHTKLEKCQMKLKTFQHRVAQEKLDTSNAKKSMSVTTRQHEEQQRLLTVCRAARMKFERLLSHIAAGTVRGDDQSAQYYLNDLSRLIGSSEERHQREWRYEREMRHEHEVQCSREAPAAIKLMKRSSDLALDEAPYTTTSYSEHTTLMDQPKYDILVSCVHRNDFNIDRIKNALPPCSCTHFKTCSSTIDVKICLDNTGTGVVAIVDREYESNPISEADLIHIFKRQLPLVLVISDHEFVPQTSWLVVVWSASNTRKVFLQDADFEENIRKALSAAQWDLPESSDTSEISRSAPEERSSRFLGDLHEWAVAYRNPAQVSQNYRQLLSDPLRMADDTKLQDFYFKYIRVYFVESSLVTRLFQQGVRENDIRHFVQAYTSTDAFYATVNRHLAAHVLFYFESTLCDTVDYQLVKCLIDFVALLIYREELSPYIFAGIVYRGMMVSPEDLHRYVVGSRLMNTTFLSTSKNRDVAEMFSGENEDQLAVLCTYEVHSKNNRRTAILINCISKCPDENEVLLLPFSAFHVAAVKRSTKKSEPIEIKLVEDDYDAVEDDLITTSTSY